MHRDRRLGVGEVIVHPIFEGDANKGQTIKRSGADDVDAGRGVESNLRGTRVVTFHLLGGEARRLRGNFQDDRSWIRIRFDVELLKSNEPGADKQQQTHHHNRTAAQAKRDRDLNMACRLSWNGRTFGLIRWRRLQHIAEEYRAVCYDQFSLLQTV